MMIQRFKVILGVIVVFCCTVLVIYWELVVLNVNGLTASTAVTKRPKLYQKSADVSTTGTFQRLQQDLYIYSAFIDEQQQVVRLIILTGKCYQPKIVCHFCDDHTTCQCPPQMAQYYTNNENHARQYGGYIVSCKLSACHFDSHYIHVSIDGQASQIQVPLIASASSGTMIEYSICIPPLRGEGIEFLYQLTEFIEVSLKLGAGLLTFYDYKTDEPIKRLLAYYRKKGVVRLLLWDIPSHLTRNVNQLWYHGQVLAVQDCLYRNKATSKFVAFNDIDEYIVPLKHNSVPRFLHDIHTAQHCGYCFDSVIFSLNARIPGVHGKKKSKLRTLRIQYRTSKTLPSWSKCIVDPQQVFEMGIHHISKSTNEKVTAMRVSDNDALVFHYRKCSSAYGIGDVCGDLVADNTINRFTTKLQQRVDQVINYTKKT